MKLSSARAVITGGASGLGLATAERVVEAGGKVVIYDINDEQGQAAASKLGSGAMYLRTDVADEASVQASTKGAADFMGGVTLAVNCAGIATAGRTLGRMVETNDVAGAYAAAVATLRQMGDESSARQVLGTALARWPQAPELLALTR